MQGIRRDRSRSPINGAGRRRDNNVQDGIKNSDVNNPNVINPMIMSNMYTQGNMMMAGGLYPNMIMPGAMMGSGLMPSAGIEMIPGSGLELVPQQTLDMSSMAGQQMPGQPMPGQSITPSSGSAMEMSMMSGMMVDPTMLGMFPGMSSNLASQQEKQVIVLKQCKLFPPDSGTAHPPHRVKPPGCRTIFVGGLPDKIRESTVREIFENYGRIHTLRLSKKNFCHIRFDRESCVDAAMAISGYRIKLISKEKDDKEEEDDSNVTNGWLHVDYALSRDDQNEYERRQRQVIRAQQAQMEQLTAQHEMANRNMNYERLRSPSPVKIQPFSNVAVVQLAEKIKSEEHFSNSVPTLLAWLERGECSKKNSNQFYSMIQATNTHIRRLFNEKMQAEEELQECKDRVKIHIERVIEQLEQVAKVFNAATHQRVWDHFTKPQRKNIETWQKMTQEFNALKEELNEKFYNDESDTNGFTNKISDYNIDELQNLRKENESLQFQLEAYKNEIDVIKADAQKEFEKFKAQLAAQQALHELEKKNPPLPLPVEKPPPPPPLPEDLDATVQLKQTVEAGCGEARLIGVMSAFLQVHPNGASLDYVVSYVRAIFPSVTQATIHYVLQRHPDVFKRTTSGVGANIEHKWSFVAFHKDDTS